MAKEWDGTGTKQEDDECPVCYGEGIIFVRNERKENIARKCPACNCLRDARVKTLYRTAGIPVRTPRDAKVDDAVRYYLNRYPLDRRGDNWLLLIGKPGSGKTTQASWLACELIERYQAYVRFYNAFDLVRRFVALRKRNDEYEREFDVYLDADVVIIDDLFKSIPSEKSYNYGEYKETLLELIWARYDAKKPLVITTQRNFSDVARFDAALAGRIAESCADRVVAFDSSATNWRVREKHYV